jgi:hypothetical protein
VFDVEAVAPGMFEVERYGSDDTHTVDVRSTTCTCQDYIYTVAHRRPLDRCKHLELMFQIADGELCPHCTMPTCRPSCPERGDRR